MDKLTHGLIGTYHNHKCRCKLCKDAWNTYYTEYRNRPGSKHNNRSRMSRGCEYFTDKQAIALLKKQRGKCAICQTPLVYPDKGTHVDHDHQTGRVRGILCRDCNHGIGKFKDDPKLLEQGAKYLRKL